MKRFLAFVLLLLVAGSVLWYLGYRPQGPQISQAALKTPALSTTQVRSVVTQFDHTVAQAIRKATSEGIKLPQVGSWQALQDWQQATVSAQISTSPQELWQTLRQEGSQAVVSGLAKNAEVSVNEISTQVMSEARYQYCVGVVEEYQRQQRPAATNADER